MNFCPIKMLNVNNLYRMIHNDKLQTLSSMKKLWQEITAADIKQGINLISIITDVLTFATT